jgi:cytochrome b
MQRILIWDLPTRLFHWTLALCFAGAWLTSESDPWLGVHVFLGYLMLGLVVFRVIWGVLGTHYARFSSFWFGPKAALTYVGEMMAGKAARHVGHNPAGSLAIYLLLLLTLVVGVTGFFTLGGEEQQGAVTGLLNMAQGRLFKKLHEAAAVVMLLLVMTHIAGVVVESLLHKENLARSMVTGTKLADAGSPAAQPRKWVAVLMLVLIAAFAGWWFFYALHTPLEKQLGHPEVSTHAPTVAFVGPKLADNAQWREECGSCHLAFHPSLLPARSWTRLMKEQAQHFGADLAFDAPTSAALLAFMTANSADQKKTEAAFKIGKSLPADAVPLRITETPYWIKKHHDITDAQWKQPQVKSKANCAACHQDAEAGTFEDGAMQMPKDKPAPKVNPL